MNSGKKDDRGTIVIEMCIIMPIVITVIFVVINMMIVQLNNGIATGEAYHVVCNRERYMSGSGNSAEDTLNQILDQMVRWSGHPCSIWMNWKQACAFVLLEMRYFPV